MCMRYAVPGDQIEECPFCHSPLIKIRSKWWQCSKCHRAFDEWKLESERKRMEELRREN